MGEKEGGKGAPIWEIEWGMIFWHLIRFDTRRKINGSNKESGGEGNGKEGDPKEGQRHSKIPFPFGFIGSEINEV